MAHPTVGGKGLPPVVSAPVYLPSSPATSTAGYGGGYLAASSSSSSSRLPPYYSATTAGPPPDLTARLQLKAKYARIQARYNRAIETRRDLTIELEEKEATQQRLQDEVDLIIDQIHDSDYAHLRPKRDSLFSDDDDDEDEDDGEEDDERREEANGAGPGNNSKDDATEGGEPRAAVRKGKRKADERDLDDLEDERRKQLEAHYGVDGTRQNVSRMPTPPPPPPRIPSAAQPAAPISQQPADPAAALAVSASLPPPQSASIPTPAPAPTRIKLKFGGGGGSSSAAGPA